MRAVGVILAGKTDMICGYGDLGRSSAQSLMNSGARCIVSEIEPTCAFQATMEGYQVATLDNVIKDVDIVITTTCNLTATATLTSLYLAPSNGVSHAVERAVLWAQNASGRVDSNCQALLGLLHASGTA